MADEPLKFPSGADVAAKAGDAQAKAQLRVQTIMLAKQMAEGKNWTADETERMWVKIHNFLTEK